MSGSSWVFGGGLHRLTVTQYPCDSVCVSDTARDGQLEAVGVGLDRDHQLGEVAVADDPPELLLGDEHRGGGPAYRLRHKSRASVLPG